MTANGTSAHEALVAAAAEAALSVPGVAFLRPGFGGLLRSALSARSREADPTAGVRLVRGDGSGPWRVEVRVVARAEARTVDVARAVRAAVRDRLKPLLPAAAGPPRVVVTVTGLL
ncbi:hypothetical protein [Streptomyces sp. NPDC005805]|uniref:hypothetical protein n=1 Tax=Streptomyces sp. NPDC005805 TaxID=3157068 RepID=UPI0033FA645A